MISVVVCSMVMLVRNSLRATRLSSCDRHSDKYTVVQHTVSPHMAPSAEVGLLSHRGNGESAVTLLSLGTRA